MKYTFVLVVIFGVSTVLFGQSLDTNFITLYEEGDVKFYKTRVDGLFGLVNQQEEVMLPHLYSHISNFTKTLLRVKCPEEGYGLLDRSFREVLPCQYKRLECVQGIRANALTIIRKVPIKTYYLKQGDGDSLFTIIDMLGNELSRNAFHSPETLIFYGDVILDDLSGGLRTRSPRDYRMKDMLGNEILNDPIFEASVIQSATGEALFEGEKKFLSVRHRNRKCALFNLDTKALVTEYEYDFIYLPPAKHNEDPEFVIGKSAEQLFLLSFNGDKISEMPFETIAIENNFNRKYLEGLKFDDTNVEAFMKTAEGDYYLMRSDLTVERISD